MKILNTFYTFFFILLISITISCRQEEFRSEGLSPDETLSANSNLANLLVRISYNDGSKDNIIDQASCISLVLPVTVNVNGTEVLVNTKDDFEVIENIFEQNDEDTDVLDIIFPVTILFPDFSEEVVFNAGELQDFVDTCSGENQNDEDIECIDLVYPITITMFNSNSEKITTKVIPNDKALFNFVSSLQNTDVVNINFPISLVLASGMELIATDFETLENHIESANGTCDEDDDNDFNDDDCNDCDTNQLAALFASCNEWLVDTMLRNNTDLNEIYNSFTFDFQADGTLMVISDSNTFNGTWSASGTNNLISLEIFVQGLDDFNGIWLLNRIAADSNRVLINLRMGNDRLLFDNGCVGENGGGNAP